MSSGAVPPPSATVPRPSAAVLFVSAAKPLRLSASVLEKSAIVLAISASILGISASFLLISAAHLTFSGRFGRRPNPTWNFGLSLSSGTYIVREAEPSLPAGRDVGDYRELLVAQDISFEWHHLQLGPSFMKGVFEVPRVGNVDTFAYYAEGKYKITPQLYGALRWNHQVYDSIPLSDGGHGTWGGQSLAHRCSPRLSLHRLHPVETAI